MGARQRKQLQDTLQNIPDNEERIIIATGRYLGEGVHGAIVLLDSQEYEDKGVKPCTIKFSQLANEYMQWWTDKDHGRVRLVLW